MGKNQSLKSKSNQDPTASQLEGHFPRQEDAREESIHIPDKGRYPVRANVRMSPTGEVTGTFTKVYNIYALKICSVKSPQRNLN